MPTLGHFQFVFHQCLFLCFFVINSSVRLDQPEGAQPTAALSNENSPPVACFTVSGSVLMRPRPLLLTAGAHHSFW